MTKTNDTRGALPRDQTGKAEFAQANKEEVDVNGFPLAWHGVPETKRDPLSPRAMPVPKRKKGQKPKPRLPPQLLHELNGILHANGSKRVNGGKAMTVETEKTHRARIIAILLELESRGEGLRRLGQLSHKTVNRLVEAWVKKGIPFKTIEGNLATLRFIGILIGKTRLVLPPRQYYERAGVPVPEREGRSAVVTTDSAESWIRRVADENDLHGVVLELVYRFGLTPLEAILLRPGADIQTGRLVIVKGTKANRRSRSIAIDSDAKRAVLLQAQGFVVGTKGQMLSKESGAQKVREQFNSTLKKVGLTQKSAGITATALRLANRREEMEKLGQARTVVMARLVENLARLSLKELLNLETKAAAIGLLTHSKETEHELAKT